MRIVTLPDGRSVHSINRHETSYLYQEIFLDETYLPPGDLDLPDRPVIVDAGANIGLFTLFAADRWPRAQLFSVEPVPQIFEVLRQNVGHLPDTRLFNLALGAHEEERKLTFYPRYAMMSGFDADPETDRALVHAYLANVASILDDERGGTLLAEADDLLQGRFEDHVDVPCAVRTLSSLTADSGIRHIDFLKIDVEGAEVAVLQGISDSLWPRIAHAAVEVEDDDGALQAVTDLFTSHGMQPLVHQVPAYLGTSVYMVFAAH